MDIQLIVAGADLPLFEALAPAIRRLSGDILFQGDQFLRGEGANHAALGNTPELAVPILNGEHDRFDLLVDAVILAIPVHDAALGFFRHPVVDQSSEDLTLIAPQHPSVQQSTVILHLPILVAGVEVRRQRHIQLQRGGLGRQDREAVLSDGQRQGSAIVPLHVELPGVVDVVQSPRTARLQRGIGVFHLSELDP